MEQDDVGSERVQNFEAETTEYGGASEYERTINAGIIRKPGILQEKVRIGKEESEHISDRYKPTLIVSHDSQTYVNFWNSNGTQWTKSQTKSRCGSIQAQGHATRTGQDGVRAGSKESFISVDKFGNVTQAGKFIYLDPNYVKSELEFTSESEKIETFEDRDKANTETKAFKPGPKCLQPFTSLDTLASSAGVQSEHCAALNSTQWRKREDGDGSIINSVHGCETQNYQNIEHKVWRRASFRKKPIRTHTLKAVTVICIFACSLVLVLQTISRSDQPQEFGQDSTEFHTYLSRRERSNSLNSSEETITNSSEENSANIAQASKLFDTLEGVVGDEETKNESDTKCQPPVIVIMPEHILIQGGWVVYVIIGIYMFSAIASICDVYFVPSLEHICEALSLDPDVAGATFMAAASSAPEFATSIIGSLQENDVGLSAILGSSIFNLLAIIGLCGIFAGQAVHLSWYPLTRDSLFYLLAVTEMLAFMYDGIVHWYEALVMVITYGLYILVMVYNKKIELLANSNNRSLVENQPVIADIHPRTSSRVEFIHRRSLTGSLHVQQSRASYIRQSPRTSSSHRSKLSEISQRPHERDTPKSSSNDMSTIDPTRTSNLVQVLEHVPHRVPSELPPTDVREGHGDVGSSHISQKSEAVSGVMSDIAHTPRRHLCLCKFCPRVEPECSRIISNNVETDEGIAEYQNPLEFPTGCISRTYWILVLPITVLHVLTIPDSRIKNSWQSRFYLIPFMMCVAYLSVYSYIMVWAIGVAAWTLSIPETVAGLTILAAGTSVPDCLSSILVARGGFGDMAVSNAIGSNVFDILLCLGIPWLIQGAINSDGHDIKSEAMVLTGLTLLLTIVYLVVSLKVCNWTLTVFYGLITMVFYFGIITFCILVITGILFSDGVNKGNDCVGYSH